jgi:tRNA threonylcarbamoyladenosine biosynthesis protein TsaE
VGNRSDTEPTTERDALLTEAELTAWGAAIGRTIGAPAVLALRGDLGAGKSTLARAIARGLGIDGPVPSPTFNLLFSYATPRGIRLQHLDLYRLEDPEEVWDLGWAELGTGFEVVLIEWPERAEALLPEPRWDILLEETNAPERRRITVVPRGGAEASALPEFPQSAEH